MAAPRKPEDVLAEEDVLADELTDDLPKTPRSSFNTWKHTDLPKGMPSPPSFRAHAQHVENLEEFLEAVEDAPNRLVSWVKRSRQERLKDLGWTR